MVSKLRYYSFKIELTQKNPGRVNPKGRMHATYFMQLDSYLLEAELQILPLGSSGKILPPLGFLTKAGDFIAINCNDETCAKIKTETPSEYYINKAAFLQAGTKVHTLQGKQNREIEILAEIEILLPLFSHIKATSHNQADINSDVSLTLLATAYLIPLCHGGGGIHPPS